MRQRLGIAAALLRRPRLLLLDEPTSGLDPAGTRAVAALVRELAAQGVAVLLSSHQIGELEKVCDSYTVVRDGRVVWDGTAAELDAQAPGSAYALFTSDDAHALALASRITAVRIQRAPRGGLAVAARPDGMDELVAALGDAHVLIRRLELIGQPAREHVLRAHHRRRSGGPRRAGAAAARRQDPGRRMTTISPTAPAARPELGISEGVRNAYETELHKLMAQLTTRILILVCAIGPFAFAVILKVQSGTPSDALFGVWVHSSGFAITLVILGFAGSWGFPIVAGVLAGDLFSSEDRHGTWKTILTRSCTREDVFAGKLLAVGTLVARADVDPGGDEPDRRDRARRTARAREPQRQSSRRRGGCSR